MFAYLTGPGFQPFAIAGLVLIGLCAVEAASLLLGHSLSGVVDSLLGLDHPEVEAPEAHGPDAHGPDAHGPGTHGPGEGNLLHLQPEAAHMNLFGSFYDWLNAGRVPLLILLMAALGAFSVSGLVLQTVAMHVASPLPGLVAGLLAFLAVIPTTRFVSRMVARLLPRDESYAVDLDDLVGRVGVVTLGPVEAESAGRAKVQDPFGNWHFPRVMSARPGLVIQQGTAILVVDRIGTALSVVPAAERQLAR